MVQFTDLAIKGAKPPATGNAYLWDTAVRGFGLRISTHGTKTFCVLIGSGRRQGDGVTQRQGSFSQTEYAGMKKQTRRDKFLAEMERVVPWSRLVDRLRPFYPKGERGRPPIGLERMLRLYFLQQWYGLADEALEDALYDSQALRGFAGIDLSGDAPGHHRPGDAPDREGQPPRGDIHPDMRLHPEVGRTR